ncbi:hypothetical protein [Acetanaerobacterium elongatum]|uniref:Uncharacterized protein n=1 Tax=Acetanaerobacterium elongatum TaxID=258515 RepID=A0A1H0ETZ1_9FIRM|nr:hypothetical protein [Acetanaerobacterium elongatum]SDN85830.1 hypothetical protein SAMN05192585_1369 [Acetanaerobacterium elongatum]
MSFEISGNLKEYESYDNFCATLLQVMNLFVAVFGLETMLKIDLYIDNALYDKQTKENSMSGYTPITTLICSKYIVIKLNISDFSQTSQIIYQFAHELCHYVFYSIYGIDKPKGDNNEEAICSAMSLCTIKSLYPQNLEHWKEHVRSLSNIYGLGYPIAEELNYDIYALSERILTYNKEHNLAEAK